MTRILGLDYGTARVGVAVSDPLGLTAQPLDHIPARDRKQCLHAIAALCRERDVGRIVLGLPRQLDGDEGLACKDARAFGERVQQATGLAVEYFDERMTTGAVERVLIDADVSRTRRKQKIDSMAAALLLQNYLDAAG
jgi:putative Holliday junction resolvase